MSSIEHICSSHQLLQIENWLRMDDLLLGTLCSLCTLSFFIVVDICIIESSNCHIFLLSSSTSIHHLLSLSIFFIIPTPSPLLPSLSFHYFCLPPTSSQHFVILIFSVSLPSPFFACSSRTSLQTPLLSYQVSSRYSFAYKDRIFSITE